MSAVFGLSKATTIGRYKQAILATPDLRAYWPLQESSTAGPWIDLVRGYALFLSGSVTLGPSLIGGPDRSIYTASGSLRSLGAGWPLFSMVSQITVEVWYQAAATTNFACGCWRAGGFMLYAASSNLRFYTADTWLDFGRGLTVGETLHIVGTFDGTDRRAYVNGVLVAGPTAGEAIDFPNNGAGVYTGDQIEVGGYASSSPSAKSTGYFGHFALYYRALTGAEVLAHYLAASG
jgi:hypothetical protein